MKNWTLLLTLVALAGAAVAPAARALQSTAGAEAEKLNAFFREEWEWTLREFPAFATAIGDRRYDDRLTDMSFEAIEARKRHAREALARIRTVDREALSEEDHLNYDLFVYDLQREIEGQRFPSELLQINQLGGVYSDLAEVAQQIPRFNVRDFENFIARIRAVPTLVDQHIALLRRGLESGVMPARVILRDVGQLIQNQIVEDPKESPIYEIVFAEMPAAIPAAEQTRLRESAAAALSEVGIPAFRKLHAFFVDEYEPGGRATIGLSELPDGMDWYAYRVRRETTSDLTAEQIHTLGLAEVKRIRSEMERIKDETGFRGSLAEFFDFLRTDPRFFFTEEEALLTAYRDIAKRIDPELPKLFGRLPRLPYGVIPVPDYSEKTQTTAYYQPGSAEAGRAGLFYANTYDLPSRPRWEMEALTVHEAVPGHHLQISLAQELTGVPEFRRWLGFYTAFVEGWALYSESLGAELGLYRDPYARFGQLTYEIWRAVRLVVDTGMHAKGWTRERAIEFFEENAGKAEHDIVVEVDRYIAWPGQALAYKIGELKIKELRRYAERELGERFDIRNFHDTVLGAGGVPLPILEARVRTWVESRHGEPSAEPSAGGMAGGS